MMRAASGITERAGSSTRRRYCLVLSVLVGLFVFANMATAHPVPPARAVLDLQADGKCKLRIACDVSALVMQTTPGHLGKAAEELQALSQEELQARVDDAQQAIEYYLELKFDDVRQTKLTVQMPPLKVVQGGAAHGGEDARPEILMQGSWPADAKTCEVTFPSAIGRVQFKLIRQGETLLTREFAAGKSSGPITLTDRHAIQSNSPSDWIGWIIAALLLAYLVRLYLGRPKYPAQPYSRNTSTGQ
jgi:hypothetical protein